MNLLISTIFDKKPLVELNDCTANHLISIKNDKLKLENIIVTNKNVKVISILGEARKGKSTLLNTIISSYTKSNNVIFKTSKSLDHCTQGIDFFHIPDLNIIFCDVQGLKVGNSANDPKLLLITYLMSDIIIFTQQQMLNKSVLETFSPLSSFLTYIDFEQIDTRNCKPELIFRISDFTLDGTPQENLDKLFVEHEDQSKNIIINMKRLFGKITAYNTNQLDRSESKMLDNLDFYGLLENDENGFYDFIKKLNDHIFKIDSNNIFSNWYKNLDEFIKLINDNKKIDFNKLDVYKLLTEKELYEYEKALRKSHPDMFTDLIINHTETDYQNKICQRIKIKENIIKEFNIKFAMVNDNLKKDTYNEIISEINSKIDTAIESNRDQAYNLLSDFIKKQPIIDIIETKLDINNININNNINEFFTTIEKFIINNDINDYTINLYKNWKSTYTDEYINWRKMLNYTQLKENNIYLSLVSNYIEKLSDLIKIHIIYSEDYHNFLLKSFDVVNNELITKFNTELKQIPASVYSLKLITVYHSQTKFPNLKIEIINNPIDYSYEYIKKIFENGLNDIKNIAIKNDLVTYYIMKKKQILKNSKLYNAKLVDIQLSSNIANINKDICKFYKLNDYNGKYFPIYQLKKIYLLNNSCSKLIKDKFVFVKKTHIYVNYENKNYKFNCYHDMYNKLLSSNNTFIPICNFNNTEITSLKTKLVSIINDMILKFNNYNAYNIIKKEELDKIKKDKEKLKKKHEEKLIILNEKEELDKWTTEMAIAPKILEVNKNKVVEKYRKKSIPKSLKKYCWDIHIGPDIGTAKCLCCKHQDIRQIEFHCGHVISEKNGGETSIKNLRPICAQCNLSMQTKNMDEFMKSFI
jgi:5-methylcytosine-specific restriction endonuclease McrA